MHDLIYDKVLPRIVGFHNRRDEILGNVMIIRQKLLCVLGQTVAAIAKGGVVIVIPDARIQANTLDNGLSVQTADRRIGIKLIEEAHAQRQKCVGKELDGLCLGGIHAADRDILPEGACLKGFGKPLCGDVHLRASRRNA